MPDRADAGDTQLCRHVTDGHTAILDLERSVGILVVPGPERNWVVSTETQVTEVGGLAFETIVERCRYDEGSRDMAAWLQAVRWRYASNDSAAGLPLEAGFTDDGSTVYLLVPVSEDGRIAQDEPAV